MRRTARAETTAAAVEPPAANRTAADLVVDTSAGGGGRPQTLHQPGRQGCQRQRQAPPRQAPLQPLPCPRQARQHRAPGAAQQGGGLAGAVSFEITEDDGGAVLFRQPINLRIEDRPQVAPGSFVEVGGGKVGLFARLRPAAHGFGPGAQGDAVSDLVEPAAEGLVLPDRVAFADEGKEGGLEGILGVLRVAQQTAAQVPDHLAVAPDQHLEGSPVAGAEEAAEQFAVGRAVGTLAGGELAQVSEQGGRTRASHGCPSLRKTSLQYSRGRKGQPDSLFFLAIAKACPQGPRGRLSFPPATVAQPGDPGGVVPAKPGVGARGGAEVCGPTGLGWKDDWARCPSVSERSRRTKRKGSKPRNFSAFHSALRPPNGGFPGSRRSPTV
jgi:hypothetical protein